MTCASFRVVLIPAVVQSLSGAREPHAGDEVGLGERAPDKDVALHVVRDRPVQRPKRVALVPGNEGVYVLTRKPVKIKVVQAVVADNAVLLAEKVLAGLAG